MQESDLERKLKVNVEAAGGQCHKWVSPGKRGVPDRICLFPEGRLAFVEMKAPGKKLRPLQRKRKKELELLGFNVFAIDSTEGIQAFINVMTRGET